MVGGSLVDCLGVYGDGGCSGVKGGRISCR